MTYELSRGGVCYDLAETPFTFEWRGYDFHFSSAPHRSKFIETVNQKCEWLGDSFRRRFKFHVNAEWLAVFNLYRQVETRGFYVVGEGGEVYRSVEAVRFRVCPDGRL